jgi:superfamily II DNA or RNA helicase
MRVVSSSKYHDYPKNIDLSDDIVIITTQTAIKQLSLKKDLSHEQFESIALNKWLESCKDSGLLIVLDEAHHAPAYGCRHLLLDIIQRIPNSFLLGLTATPMHLDPNLSGWIPKFFGPEPIYTVTRDELIHKKILAKPRVEQMKTGVIQNLSDAEYHAIVQKNQKIPDYIVDNLARNANRNEYIIQTYLQNRDKYKKTIIFADRWYQCDYIEEKLKTANPPVRVKSMYTCSVRDPDAEKAYKDPSLNEQILNEFKTGQLDVLLNVRILTEGADIPDVNTVFITRQTESPILLTQMVGRCLRGEKTSGLSEKKEANVVMFIDNWRRLLDFAYLGDDGGVEDPEIKSVGQQARYLISRKILHDLFDQIEAGITVNTAPYITFLPVGWYVARITNVVKVSLEDECDIPSDEDQPEDLETHTELLMIYEQEEIAYQSLIEKLIQSCPEEWGEETPISEEMKNKMYTIASEFFEIEEISDGEKEKIVKVCRHIAQNNTKPVFHSFEEREQYDLDKIVARLANEPMTDFQKETELRKEYNKTGSFWKVLYESIDYFRTAYDAAKAYYVNRGVPGPVSNLDSTPIEELAFSYEVKEQIRKRDGNKCRCCGATRKLEVDHIIPVTMGGKSTIDNGQLLCSICHNLKGTKTTNYVSINSTPLTTPKSFDVLFLDRRIRSTDHEITLRRIINNFYECSAIADIKISQTRKGKNFYRWEVSLFQGNNPEWISCEKEKLLALFRKDSKYSDLEDIEIK